MFFKLSVIVRRMVGVGLGILNNHCTIHPPPFTTHTHTHTLQEFCLPLRARTGTHKIFSFYDTLAENIEVYLSFSYEAVQWC